MNSTDRDKAREVIGNVNNYAEENGELSISAFGPLAKRIAAALARPEGWQWTHEHNADLIRRDGLMCEQHPGLEFDHDGCAGPGMAWVLEGKESITTALSEREVETWKAAIEAAQISAKKSIKAGLDVAAAEILIRRLESAALESAKEKETNGA